MNLAGRIVLLTGIMASGKSTIAALFAERLDKSVHLRGDVFRKMVVAGRAEMTNSPGEEAIRQLELRYDLGVATALRYAEEGFAVIYQDVILGEYLSKFANRLRSTDYLFVLCPQVDSVSQREASRSKKGYLGFTPQQLDDVLRNSTERLGYWLDSTDLTPDETVANLLAHIDEAQLSKPHT